MTEIEITREQLRVMELAAKHGIDWRDCIKVHTVKYDGNFPTSIYAPLSECQHISWQDTINPQFALTVLEGKPVFEGDVAYCHADWTKGNEKRIAKSFGWVDAKGHHCADFVEDNDLCYSWNPPNPKTLIVGLPHEVVKNAIEFSKRKHRCIADTFVIEITLSGAELDKFESDCHKAWEDMK